MQSHNIELLESSGYFEIDGARGRGQMIENISGAQQASKAARKSRLSRSHTLAHLWDLSLAGGMMKSGAKSLCCLTTYDKISHTKLCAPFLVYVFLVTSFKCRFSVTIKESLMNKESVTDVLLIMSRI